MAKTMAQLLQGTVVNLIWCSEEQTETEELRDPGEHPVCMGDTWSHGEWYREGVRVLTPTEEELARVAAENADLRGALKAIYGGETE